MYNSNANAIGITISIVSFIIFLIIVIIAPFAIISNKKEIEITEVIKTEKVYTLEDCRYSHLGMDLLTPEGVYNEHYFICPELVGYDDLCAYPDGEWLEGFCSSQFPEFIKFPELIK